VDSRKAESPASTGSLRSAESCYLIGAMLRAVSLALASLIAAQTHDDMVLCTSASDCPSGAACEDGVCVMREEVEPAPKKRRVKKKRRRRERDPNHCRRGDCETGQECYKGSCGPPVPSKGTGLLIAGGVVTGVGLLFFVNAAVCQTNRDQSEREQNVCTAITASIGAVAVAIGVPMLVIGAIRRSAFQEWLRAYHPNLAIVPTENGGAIGSLGFSF
jgi:hypothetical protein